MMGRFARLTSVMVRYGSTDSDLWQEGVIIAQAPLEGEYVVVTPDCDMVRMLLSVPPLYDMEVLGPDRKLPRRLPDDLCYMVDEEGEIKFPTLLVYLTSTLLQR